MAKRKDGPPYMLEVYALGPERMQEVETAAFNQLSNDIAGLINGYHSMDWPYVAAALEMAAQALKSDLDPMGRAIADERVKSSEIVHAPAHVGTETVNLSEIRRKWNEPQPPRGGGMTLNISGTEKGDRDNGKR